MGADSLKKCDLVFGICWYDDPSIIRCLDSLPEEAPKIIVDGRFSLLDSASDLSDQTLRDAVNSYPNVTMIDAPGLPEPRKREKYLENDHRYLFIIDSDEFVISADWERFAEQVSKLDCGIHSIPFQDENGNKYGTYPRVWCNPSDWGYWETHNIFVNKKTGEMIRSSNALGITLDAVTCTMNDEMRTKEYIKAVYDYQVKMISHEKPYRKQVRY